MIETGKAALSSRNKNILVQELNVNPDWLDSGEGEMFNAEPDLTAYMHRTDNTLPLQSVPLYSIEGTAGLVPLFADHAQTRPVNFIHIPNLPKCDGAIYIVGDSMYPLLKSGDIVLLQTAQGYRRHLLGRHVPALDRHRRRRVHHGQIHPKNPSGKGT